jgi:hypothetical protein
MTEKWRAEKYLHLIASPKAFLMIPGHYISALHFSVIAFDLSLNLVFGI